MFDLNSVQNALRRFGLDGWLLAEFRGSNVLARRVLGLDDRPVTSRRFFYAIPAEGPPRNLVHRIEEGVLDQLTLTVEQGIFGGLPGIGLDSGTAVNPAAIIDMTSQFDLYDGGALDLAGLSFAQVDRLGNVNVTRVGNTPIGPGGFIDISQKARTVLFCGTFRGGDLQVDVDVARRLAEELDERNWGDGKRRDGVLLFVKPGAACADGRGHGVAVRLHGVERRPRGLADPDGDLGHLDGDLRRGVVARAGGGLLGGDPVRSDQRQGEDGWTSGLPDHQRVSGATEAVAGGATRKRRASAQMTRSPAS